MPVHTSFFLVIILLSRYMISIHTYQYAGLLTLFLPFPVRGETAWAMVSLWVLARRSHRPVFLCHPTPFLFLGFTEVFYPAELQVNSRKVWNKRNNFGIPLFIETTSARLKVEVIAEDIYNEQPKRRRLPWRRVVFTQKWCCCLLWQSPGNRQVTIVFCFTAASSRCFLLIPFEEYYIWCMSIWYCCLCACP